MNCMVPFLRFKYLLFRLDDVAGCNRYARASPTIKVILNNRVLSMKYRYFIAGCVLVNHFRKLEVVNSLNMLYLRSIIT